MSDAIYNAKDIGDVRLLLSKLNTSLRMAHAVAECSPWDELAIEQKLDGCREKAWEIARQLTDMLYEECPLCEAEGTVEFEGEGSARPCPACPNSAGMVTLREGIKIRKDMGETA